VVDEGPRASPSPHSSDRGFGPRRSGALCNCRSAALLVERIATHHQSADRAIGAIDNGVDYFDTPVQYGTGESEKNLGRRPGDRKFLSQ
jgi:hypothetical protein